jgi:hypothetical protein
MAVSELRREEIQLEETVVRRQKTPDRSEEEREFRAQVRWQVSAMRAAGVVVEVPAIDAELF